MTAWAMFVDHPWAALIPALIFGVLWIVRFRHRGTTALKIAAALPIFGWCLYAAYEGRMMLWSKTVIAPIRADLLLVIPILAILSTIGIIALAQPAA